MVLPMVNQVPCYTKIATNCNILQGVSIAYYAEPCITYDRDVRLSVCPSVSLSHAGIVRILSQRISPWPNEW